MTVVLKRSFWRKRRKKYSFWLLSFRGILSLLRKVEGNLMKRLKLMIVTIMMFTSLFIFGESRMLTLEGFAEPFVTTTIYPNPKISEQQILTDIE